MRAIADEMTGLAGLRYIAPKKSSPVRYPQPGYDAEPTNLGTPVGAAWPRLVPRQCSACFLDRGSSGLVRVDTNAQQLAEILPAQPAAATEPRGAGCFVQ